jgi:hypothetical protein
MVTWFDRLAVHVSSCGVVYKLSPSMRSESALVIKGRGLWDSRRSIGSASIWEDVYSQIRSECSVLGWQYGDPHGAALHWTARNNMGQMRNFKVYAKEQEILETVRRNSSLIITGRPGSGKTQFLVPLLLSATAEEWFERATWSIVHTRKAHVVLPTVAQVRRAVECAQSLQRSTVGHDCAAGVTGKFKLPIHGGCEVIRYMIPDLARRDLQYLGEDDFFVLEEFDRREAFTVALRSLASWRVAVRQNLHLVCLSASAQLDLSQYLALSVETTVVDISNQAFGRLDIEMLVALASQHKVAALPYLYSQRRACRDRSNLRFVRQCSSAVDASFGTSSVSCGARI